MGPPLYTRSVADRNVVMRRIPVFSQCFIIRQSVRSPRLPCTATLTLHTVSAVLIVWFPFDVIHTKRFMQSKLLGKGHTMTHLCRHRRETEVWLQPIYNHGAIKVTMAPQPSGRFTLRHPLNPLWASELVWTSTENPTPPEFDPWTVQSGASRYTTTLFRPPRKAKVRSLVRPHIRPGRFVEHKYLLFLSVIERFIGRPDRSRVLPISTALTA
jgi:hypothetical protein